jgi:hypothetical protein
MQQGASSRATLSLVLAIGSWVICPCVMALPAVYLAKEEMRAIDHGEAPLAGRGLAQAAYWVALINTILYLVIGVLYFVFAIVLVGATAASGGRY